jgi:transcriptional regulator with XRE-family HTH domain
MRADDYSLDQWRRLGELLTDRRTAIDNAYSVRAEFLRVTGLSKKMAERLETGKPGNYHSSSLAKIARAYQVTRDSIAAALAGGDLVPVRDFTAGPSSDALVRAGASASDLVVWAAAQMKVRGCTDPQFLDFAESSGLAAYAGLDAMRPETTLPPRKVLSRLAAALGISEAQVLIDSGMVSSNGPNGVQTG